MNGFDLDEVSATKILKIPEAVEKAFKKRVKRHPRKFTPWPWYVNRELLKEVGAQFREIGGIRSLKKKDSELFWHFFSPRVPKPQQ